MAPNRRKHNSQPPKALAFVLAADAGATRTRAVVADVSGRVFGRSITGPSNSYAVGHTHALENLKRAISQALQKSEVKRSQIAAAVIGSASVDYDGSGASTVEKKLKQSLPFARIILKADALIALEGALFGDAGVVIVCGTGSIILGKDRRGRIVKIGGWGPLIGDEGSAQWVGREALRQAALGADGTGPPTLLVQRLQRQYRLRSFDRIIDAVYQHPMTPAELGSLAPIVTLAAQEGDEVAQGIFHSGSVALASQAAQATARLKLRPAKISYQGSMFNTGRLLLDPLRSKLRLLAPHAILMPPAFSPITGAFLLALKALRVGDFRPALEKFQRDCHV